MNDDEDRPDNCQELPDHLIYDIFIKLPATTLIRFRSISKQWSRIISTPAVRKHHFLIHCNNTTSRTPKNIFIHFWPRKYNEVLQFTITENMIESWSEDARNSRCTASSSLPPLASVRFPVNIGYRNGDASPSSCHGLLCLKFVHCNTYKGSVFVWNAVTSQLRQVPCPARHHFTSFLGFGYDDVNDDYKIVVTKSGWIDSGERTQIMSLKRSDGTKWRKIDTPSWGCRISNSVTIGGDIYWISYIRRGDILKENYWASQNLSEEWYYVVIKFNVTNERLTVLPSPFQKQPCDKRRMEIGQYKGTLCFFSIHLSSCENAHWANIWTLRQDRNAEVTWKSLMDVPYSPFLKYNGENCKLEFTTGGDLIICLAGYGLVVYLAQEKRYLNVPINENDPKRNHLKFARDFYFLQNESLISPLSVQYIYCTNLIKRDRSSIRLGFYFNLPRVWKFKELGEVMNDDRDTADDVCPELPDHLIYDIFIKLPPATLLRFQTLSKQWLKIISNPAVQNMIASWSEDARNSRCTARSSLPPLTSLRFPVNIGYSNGGASPSSCRGLLCLKLVHCSTYEGSVVVWNPATRQLRQVPCPAQHHFSPFLGVGYDDVNDDYKIVITKSGWVDSGERTQIMSLKRSDSTKWRKIDTPSWGRRISNSVTIGGDIYWISYIRREDILKHNNWAFQSLSKEWYYMVIQFNVTNERLTVLPFPFQKLPCDKKRMEIGQYKESLCFFSIDLSFSENADWANIWTLRQDKNGEVTWKSLMDVPYSPFLKYNGENCKLEFTTSGDLIICSAGYGLLVYLAQEKRYLNVPINENDPKRDHLRFASDFYFLQNESLFSPLSGE